MIRTAIFGAGQAGRMVRNWLPAGHELICFIDNNPSKHGTELLGVSVLPLEEALALEPDRIWVASLNTETAGSIEQQIRDAGYDGVLRYAHAFRDAQDIRLAGLRLIAEEINSRDEIRSDGNHECSAPKAAVAELGVFRGEFAAEINRLFPDGELYLFDTFTGFDESDLAKEAEITGGAKTWHPDFTDTSVEAVRERLPYPEKVHFVKGYFPGSTDQLTPEESDQQYIFVNIDPDLYEPTIQGLRYFWPRMAQGGIIMIHDYNSMQFPGVRQAVREFCRETGAMPVPLADLHGTAVIVR